MNAFASPISLTHTKKVNSTARFICCQQQQQSTESIADVTAPKSNKKTIAESLAEQLRNDLPLLFTAKGCPSHYEMFSEKVVFRDPLTSFEGVQPYRMNVAFLRDSPVFERTSLDTFDVRVTSPNTVTTRWSMAMTVRLFPWRPRVKFTGESIYELNDDGKIIGHIDYWDSLSDTANKSVVTKEAVADLVNQFTPQRHFQSLGANPSFLLLLRMKDIEIRDYKTVKLVKNAASMVSGGIAEVRRNNQSIGLSNVSGSEEAVGLVATAVLEKGMKAEECAKAIIDEVQNSGVARVVENELPLVVRYRKNSFWDNACFWQPSIQEVWIPVEDVDIDAGKFDSKQ